MVRGVDYKDDRTLGIITKADLIDLEQDLRMWLDTASNLNLFVGLGWYVLALWPRGEEGNLDQRTAAEAAFFRYSNFETQPPAYLSTPALLLQLQDLNHRVLSVKLKAIEDSVREHVEDIAWQMDALVDRSCDLCNKR
jgi:hypothetical protein